MVIQTRFDFQVDGVVFETTRRTARSTVSQARLSVLYQRFGMVVRAFAWNIIIVIIVKTRSYTCTHTHTYIVLENATDFEVTLVQHA